MLHIRYYASKHINISAGQHRNMLPVFCQSSWQPARWLALAAACKEHVAYKWNQTAAVQAQHRSSMPSSMLWRSTNSTACMRLFYPKQQHKQRPCT